MLIYCQKCKDETERQNSGIAIPLTVIDAEPDRILTLLYEVGATASDPDTASEVIGVSPGSWARRAKQVLDASSGAQSGETAGDRAESDI